MTLNHNLSVSQGFSVLCKGAGLVSLSQQLFIRLLHGWRDASTQYATSPTLTALHKLTTPLKYGSQEASAGEPPDTAHILPHLTLVFVYSINLHWHPLCAWHNSRSYRQTDTA